MIDTIISILVLIIAMVGITKLNKRYRPDYIKNYSFKRDFLRDNKKLVFWFCIVSFFIVKTHCPNPLASL